jgi:hypothetical protein
LRTPIAERGDSRRQKSFNGGISIEDGRETILDANRDAKIGAALMENVERRRCEDAVPERTETYDGHTRTIGETV